jgi:hypothetical protein
VQICSSQLIEVSGGAVEIEYATIPIPITETSIIVIAFSKFPMNIVLNNTI